MTVETEFPAMGTRVWARVESESSVPALIEWFETVERAASRFDSSSDLSILNRAPQPDVEVGSVLADILRAAAEMAAATGGLIDPSVGTAVRAWGYDRSFPDLQPPEVIPIANPASPWHIDGLVVSRSPGTLLDLGGIAKGWACDRAVEGGLASVVSAGGDVRSSDPRLVVEILHPGGGRAALIPLGRGALATSSTARRRWRIAGRVAHHLIDPRSGEPVHSPVVSATVVAASGVAAEAGAKAVLIHGAAGLSWAADTPWIDGAVAVWNDGSVYATKVAAA